MVDEQTIQDEMVSVDILHNERVIKEIKGIRDGKFNSYGPEFSEALNQAILVVNRNTALLVAENTNDRE